MENLLKLEHENNALYQRNMELEAELNVYKTQATEYAKIISELRRDMNGMSRIIDELRKGAE